MVRIESKNAHHISVTSTTTTTTTTTSSSSAATAATAATAASAAATIVLILEAFEVALGSIVARVRVRPVVVATSTATTTTAAASSALVETLALRLRSGGRCRSLCEGRHLGRRRLELARSASSIGHLRYDNLVQS